MTLFNVVNAHTIRMKPELADQLTPTEKRMFEYISAYSVINGYGPPMVDIMQHLCCTEKTFYKSYAKLAKLQLITAQKHYLLTEDGLEAAREMFRPSRDWRALADQEAAK